MRVCSTIHPFIHPSLPHQPNHPSSSIQPCGLMASSQRQPKTIIQASKHCSQCFSSEMRKKCIKKNFRQLILISLYKNFKRITDGIIGTILSDGENEVKIVHFQAFFLFFDFRTNVAFRCHLFFISKKKKTLWPSGCPY